MIVIVPHFFLRERMEKVFERKTKEGRPVLAICYDFDKTLSPDDMQAQGYIQSVGYEVESFWKESNGLAESNDMDQNLAYMYTMIQKARGRFIFNRKTLMDYGAKVSLFPGVDTWFKRIREYGETKGVIVEHYIISSGLKEMIEGTKVANEFEKIYASSFYYDENGEAKWPAQVINYTSKTQFLFRIVKGTLDVNDSGVNDYFNPEDIRIPFRYSLPTFRKSELCALGKTEIKDFFSEEEWNNIVKSEVLTRLLSNPMMVTIYKEICSVVNDSKNLHFLNWRFPIMCEADLFHNYYVAQQALLTLRGQVDGYKMLLSQVCIDEILPNIAYCYESSFRMNIEDEEFRKLLTGMLDNVVIENVAIHAIRQYYREASELSLDPYQVIDFLTQEMRLLYMNQGTTAFPHQMFRDYLSAKYIVKQTNSKKDVLALWNERPIPFSIISNIRQLDKQYWHHTAQCVRQEAAKIANVSVLVQNLFDAFPSSNKDNVADFSELDLRSVKLPNSALQTSRISLKDAIIDNVTLGISMGMPICHKHLTLSSDKEFLATWADKRIYVFSLRQSTAPYVFDFGRDLSKMVFVENRLFVLAGKLYVFVYKNSWVFSGEIGQEDGICHKLKSIIVGNNTVHLYYPNCEVIYSLTDFTRKTINQGKDKYLNPVQGHEISILNRYEKKQFDKSHGEIDKVGDENFCAISYADGRLILEHENETIGILARGKARLKDATISGDGSKAITLSYEVFGGRRRVQLWNLNNGSKLEELTCPSNVDSIHLSENGDWMLGKMFRHGTWVYDVRLHKEQVFEEYFLSSNRGKIFCKDDCVVRKEEGKVFLYNLRTGKSSIIDSPVADPSLICILRDNSIAAVNNKGNVAKIRSFRDQSLLTFNGGYSTIESIGLFEEQPFIAVALANGNLDMYHTGNGAVLRHLQLPNKNSMMVVHPQKTIIVESDGHHILKTHYYFEKYSYGKRMGWWKEHPYHGPKNIIDGDILDIGFNVQNDQIVAVLSNGRIMFCSDDWTDYKYSFYIITAFDVAAYDFSEVQCSEELKDVLRRNKAL